MTPTSPVAQRPAAQRPALSVQREDDILVVTIDKPGDSVNTLSPSLVGEFEGVPATVAGLAAG